MTITPSRGDCVALIESRGVRDGKVLAALRAIPREVFVSPALRAQAYSDRPLPIGHEQTISQPTIVAVMIEALQLQGHERVLEVGAGSGYASAVLSKIVPHVFAIERIPDLADVAKSNLAAAKCSNVSVRCGDGTEGWREKAPFDAILVSAGGPRVPAELLGQLAIGGRMVIPIGDAPLSQDLVRVTRRPDGSVDEEIITSVRFVPLVGKSGWHEDGSED
jgi:protein-L-isoaspartate(D-aspartate) O-methyltransferase